MGAGPTSTRGWSPARLGGCVAGGAVVALVLLGARADGAQAQLPGLPIINPFTVVSKLFGKAAEGVSNAVVSGFASLMEYLFDGLINTVTLGFIRWMTQVDLVFSDELNNVVAPVVVIGAFFLLIGLMASSLQAMAAVASGTDTAARAFSAVALRIGALAVFMGAWFTILPLGVNLANGMSSFMLSDPSVEAALKQTFIVQGTAAIDSASGCGAACGVAPILLLLLLLVVSFTVVVMLILKYVLTFGFAVLYVGGPALIGAGGIPGIGPTAINMLIRTLGIFIVIPLTWCIVFAAWVGVSAGLGRAPGRAGDAVLYSVIDGPGLFAASMLVLLGVTRKLLKMASPLGAPIGIPGARMLAAIAAYKVGGPALKALGGKTAATQGTGQGAAAAGSPGVERGDLPYVHAQRDQQPAARATERLSVPTSQHDGRLAPSPVGAANAGPATSAAVGAARERIAGLKATGQALDVQSAWESLNADEQGAAAGAAAQALTQENPAASFEDLMARQTADGAFSNPQPAAVVATADPAHIQRLASGTPTGRSPAGSTPPAPPTPEQPPRSRELPRSADLKTELESRGRRNEDLLYGADMRLLPPARPPVPPPDNESE